MMAAAILKLFHLKAGLIFNRLQPLFAENFPLRYRLAMYVTSSFIMIVQKSYAGSNPVHLYDATIFYESYAVKKSFIKKGEKKVYAPWSKILVTGQTLWSSGS